MRYVDSNEQTWLVGCCGTHNEDRVCLLAIVKFDDRFFEDEEEPEFFKFITVNIRVHGKSMRAAELERKCEKQGVGCGM